MNKMIQKSKKVKDLDDMQRGVSSCIVGYERALADAHKTILRHDIVLKNRIGAKCEKRYIIFFDEYDIEIGRVELLKERYD